MAVIADALTALDAHPHCVPASAWPGSLTHLDGPGLYAWWVDAPGAKDLSTGLGLGLHPGRIYVGQEGAASSRAGIPSASTLRSRIGRNHLRGKIRSSTLRRTLASVLLAPLALDLVGPRRLDAASEVKLSEWMRRHLSVAVHGVDSGEHLAEIEKHVVEALQPPLNVEHMPSNELRRRLRGLRAIVIHGIDDLWVAPDPALTDWRSILGDYGQAFDGHRFAKALGRECSAVADEVWRRFEAGGHSASSFAELRCALFWLQRCVHNGEQSPGWRPSAELEGRVHKLYRAIQEALRREGGSEA
jgi:hypothetical protein